MGGHIPCSRTLARRGECELCAKGRRVSRLLPQARGGLAI